MQNGEDQTWNEAEREDTADNGEDGDKGVEGEDSAHTDTTEEDGPRGTIEGREGSDSEAGPAAAG